MKRMKHLPIEEEDALRAVLTHHIPRQKIAEVMLNMVHDYNSLGNDEEVAAGIDQIAQAFVTRQLVEDLAELLKWVHLEEQAKASFGTKARPPLLLALLSRMGIYGRAVLKGRA